MTRYAAEYGHVTACQLLIKHKASVDKGDTSTLTTPLMAAARAGCLGTLKVLLRSQVHIHTCVHTFIPTLHGTHAYADRYVLELCSSTIGIGTRLYRAPPVSAFPVLFLEHAPCVLCANIFRLRTDIASDSSLYTRNITVLRVPSTVVSSCCCWRVRLCVVVIG